MAEELNYTIKKKEVLAYAEVKDEFKEYKTTPTLTNNINRLKKH
jgi:hypothetical protein